MPELSRTVDCLVAGAGPVGLAATIALASAGHRVAMAGGAMAPTAPALDPRTFALFEPSLRFLAHLRVASWTPETAAPLRTIRLIDDTGRLVRAPEAVFEARDVGLDAFGLNIPHSALLTALNRRLAEPDLNALSIACDVAGLEAAPAHTSVTLDSGETLRCRLVVGADGRQSVCRRLGGFDTRRWTYPQAAVVASFAHTRSHDFVSTELHRPAGPLTTVPLPGLASSIVWVERPAEAGRLGALDDRTFAAELQSRLQGFLGRIEAVGPRRVFPLEGLVATAAAAGRVALAGEALHAFPPIGAQGLNLGFRDVASLVDAISVTDGRESSDPGNTPALAAYARDRKADVDASVLLVDTLDRTLFSGLLPLQLLRGAGLHLANASPAFRRALMTRGMSPSPNLPSSMREAAS